MATKCEREHYFAIYRTDTKQYYGAYYTEGSGDAVMPSGDYPTWHNDVTLNDQSGDWVHHFETKKEAEKYLGTCKRNWGMKCDGEFKIVEVTVERKVTISQIKEQ